MKNYGIKWVCMVTILAVVGCDQASRSGTGEICGTAPICFRAEGMITPAGATHAPGPYTIVADVVSDQAVGWVRVAFRRTRQGEVQAQEEFQLEQAENGLYIGTLDGRSGDVLHYRLDTAQAGSSDLIFWPGPDVEQMLTLRLLLPGEVVDAGVGDATLGEAGEGHDAGLRPDGSPGDVQWGGSDGGTSPQPLDGGIQDAG